MKLSKLGSYFFIIFWRVYKSAKKDIGNIKRWITELQLIKGASRINRLKT